MSHAIVNAGTVEALARRVRAELIGPDHREYDASRSIFNAMVDKYPAAIVRCATIDDALSCIDVARACNVPLSIRGGGHNVAGNAICDGGLVIDFTQMRRVDVDPENQTATAEPGTTWADFDRATQSVGLATPGGIVSTTGVAGLTLGGGIGVLRGLHGLSCDNLIGAKVATATGTIVNASETENPLLLWGVRGGGGNFGVVTQFTFRLYPVSNVVAGTIIFPFRAVRKLLRGYREFMATAPPPGAELRRRL